MKTIFRKHWLKICIGLLITLLLILYYKREAIAENKIVKAKMEIFKAALESDTARIKEVIDSLDL